MKIVIAVIMSLTVQIIATADAFGSEVKATCKVETTDIGTIVGKGPSRNIAFEDAATQCFDRRAQLYRMKKGSNVDEEAGLVMIDTCANIKCS